MTQASASSSSSSSASFASYTAVLPQLSAQDAHALYQLQLAAQSSQQIQDALFGAAFQLGASFAAGARLCSSFASFC